MLSNKEIEIALLKELERNPDGSIGDAVQRIMNIYSFEWNPQYDTIKCGIKSNENVTIEDVYMVLSYISFLIFNGTIKLTEKSWDFGKRPKMEFMQLREEAVAMVAIPQLPSHENSEQTWQMLSSRFVFNN
jgi:hypothetical protein